MRGLCATANVCLFPVNSEEEACEGEMNKVFRVCELIIHFCLLGFWQIVQQAYLKVNQPDLCCPPSDRAPHSDEHFMPYANASVFRAWCENKISGILC